MMALGQWYPLGLSIGRPGSGSNAGALCLDAPSERLRLRLDQFHSVGHLRPCHSTHYRLLQPLRETLPHLRDYRELRSFERQTIPSGSRLLRFIRPAALIDALEITVSINV